MKVRKVAVDEARDFFADPSQHVLGTTPDNLPDWAEYWACEGICGVFHRAPWPDVWMAHYGVKPEYRGQYVAPAKAILRAFWDAHKPNRIVGWTEESNRAALAFNRRIGFSQDGAFPGVIMQGWTPWA